MPRNDYLQVEIARLQLAHLQRLFELHERKAQVELETAQLERDNQAFINERVRAASAANELPELTKLKGGTA